MSTPEGKGGMAADLSFEMEEGGVESMVALGELQEGVEFDDEAEVEYMAPTAYSESPSSVSKHLDVAEGCENGVTKSSRLLSYSQSNPSPSRTKSRRRRSSEITFVRCLVSSSGLPTRRIRLFLRSSWTRLLALGRRESNPPGRSG